MECKIIVESLLTASQFEVSVIETDKILMLKSSIEKILGKSQKCEIFEANHEKSWAAALFVAQLFDF